MGKLFRRREEVEEGFEKKGNGDSDEEDEEPSFHLGVVK